MRLRAAQAALLALLLACLASPAQAAGPAQVTALCEGAPNGCALTFDRWLRDGASFPVSVRGNAGARVKVVVYQATLREGRVQKLTAISTGGEVTVPNSGVTTAQVAIPAIEDALTGGWALVSLDGIVGTDTSETIGGFVPFGSRTPILLGDGYADLKPAGAELELSLTGTIPGSLFAVDYQDDDGSWKDATGDPKTANTPAATPADVAVVRYEMPRGLSAKPHQFRLRNVTSGDASITWSATPDADGTQKDKDEVATPPVVGEQVAEATAGDQRPTGMIRALSLSIGALGVVAALVGVPLLNRRDDTHD